jgi:phasin family protein
MSSVCAHVVHHQTDHTEGITMTVSNEQFAAASKAGIESFFSIAKAGFEGMEKLTELNVATAKALFDDVSTNTRAILEIKDPKELLALNTSLAQPSLEKSISYSRHVYGIVTESQAALRRAAEEQAATAQKEFAALIDKSLKSAPAGSESAVAALKSAMAAATSAYDNASKIVKQAVDLAESNFANATATATDSVVAASKSATKRK